MPKAGVIIHVVQSSKVRSCTEGLPTAGVRVAWLVAPLAGREHRLKTACLFVPCFSFHPPKFVLVWKSGLPRGVQTFLPFPVSVPLPGLAHPPPALGRHLHGWLPF